MNRKIVEPFTPEKLSNIFRFSPTDPNRVISRENSSLEFKEKFGWASLAKYMKTSAAFANVNGGYFVFGIANKPHILSGLSGDSLELFRDIDSEKMTRNFNDYFAPEIEWEISEHNINGKHFGLLYIHRARTKPVICTKDARQELKEGDIYYRYRGRTQRIRYPELVDVLESRREAEQKLWMEHLQNIARIGVQDVGILSLDSGNVIGASGSFLIDEALLNQLSFIKEGEFSETKGEPTLKLIGRLESIPTGTIDAGKRYRGIRTSEIVLAFLRQESIIGPAEYIKQICYERSAFLPVYYFIKQSGLTLVETVDMLQRVNSRGTPKEKLIQRLTERKSEAKEIPSGNSKSAVSKRELAKAILDSDVDPNIAEEKLVYCLQAIRGLNADEIVLNSKYVRELLLVWFQTHYASANSTIADNLRRAICWVDEALYADN